MTRSPEHRKAMSEGMIRYWQKRKCLKIMHKNVSLFYKKCRFIPEIKPTISMCA